MSFQRESAAANEAAWCNIDKFLARNEMLLSALADRILGGLPYNKDDIRMEGAVAYYETLDYINAFKKTKFSSVFTWFYQKRLYAKRRFDTTYVATGDKARRAGRTESGGSETDISDIPDPRSAVRAVTAMSFLPLPLSGGPAFHICIESFMGKVSMKVYRALIILSELSAAKVKKKALRNLFKCPSAKDIEHFIGSRIRNEIGETGAYLYTAACTNGAESRVIVCACSEGEARRYLTRYDDQGEIKRLC